MTVFKTGWSPAFPVPRNSLDILTSVWLSNSLIHAQPPCSIGARSVLTVAALGQCPGAWCFTRNHCSDVVMALPETGYLPLTDRDLTAVPCLPAANPRQR